MANLKSFSGFDVSKESFDVCVLFEGRELINRFAYDAQGLAAVVKWLPKGCHCVMEATGPYYLKLAFALHRQGFEVSVVNPLVIRRFSQMRLLRAKTDKADAKMIAAYGATQELSLWEPPAAYVVKLQHLEALSNQLRKQHTALLCQQEAFMATGMMDKEVKRLLTKSITQHENQIKAAEQIMESIIGQYHQELLQRVISIPGIGKKTAISLITLSNGFKKFDNYKQLSAYVGLSPRIYESGTSIRGKARICKMGMSRIRALLYLCAWSAKRYNKACKDLYDRLVEKGKSKRLALIAVANKLIKQAFAIATQQTMFQQDYSKNICL